MEQLTSAKTSIYNPPASPTVKTTSTEDSSKDVYTKLKDLVKQLEDNTYSDFQEISHRIEKSLRIWLTTQPLPTSDMVKELLPRITHYLALSSQSTLMLLRYYIHIQDYKAGDSFFESALERQWKLDARVTYTMLNLYISKSNHEKIGKLLERVCAEHLSINTHGIEIFFGNYQFDNNPDSENSIDSWVVKVMGCSKGDPALQTSFEKGIVRAYLTDYPKLERVLRKIHQLGMLTTISFNIAISHYSSHDTLARPPEINKLLDLGIDLGIYKANFGVDLDSATLDLHVDKVCIDHKPDWSIAGAVSRAIFAYLVDYKKVKIKIVITGHVHGVATKEAIAKELELRKAVLDRQKGANPGRFIIRRLEENSSIVLPEAASKEIVNLRYHNRFAILSDLIEEPSDTTENADQTEQVVPQKSTQDELLDLLSLIARKIFKTQESDALLEKDTIDCITRAWSCIGKLSVNEILSTRNAVILLIDYSRQICDVVFMTKHLEILAKRISTDYSQQTHEREELLFFIIDTLFIFCYFDLVPDIIKPITDYYLGNQPTNSKFEILLEYVCAAILHHLSFTNQHSHFETATKILEKLDTVIEAKLKQRNKLVIITLFQYKLSETMYCMLTDFDSKANDIGKYFEHFEIEATNSEAPIICGEGADIVRYWKCILLMQNCITKKLTGEKFKSDILEIARTEPDRNKSTSHVVRAYAYTMFAFYHCTIENDPVLLLEAFGFISKEFQQISFKDNKDIIYVCVLHICKRIIRICHKIGMKEEKVISMINHLEHLLSTKAGDKFNLLAIMDRNRPAWIDFLATKALLYVAQKQNDNPPDITFNNPMTDDETERLINYSEKYLSPSPKEYIRFIINMMIAGDVFDVNNKPGKDIETKTQAFEKLSTYLKKSPEAIDGILDIDMCRIVSMILKLISHYFKIEELKNAENILNFIKNSPKITEKFNAINPNILEAFTKELAIINHAKSILRSKRKHFK